MTARARRAVRKAEAELRRAEARRDQAYRRVDEAVARAEQTDRRFHQAVAATTEKIWRQLAEDRRELERVGIYADMWRASFNVTVVQTLLGQEPSEHLFSLLLETDRDDGYVQRTRDLLTAAFARVEHAKDTPPYDFVMRMTVFLHDLTAEIKRLYAWWRKKQPPDAS
jgi:hypothetical protein